MGSGSTLPVKEELNSDYVLVAPSVIKKSKEETTPLPDPFPLPSNFRPDVHACLDNKRITKSARAAFFSSVAASMFQFKRYPTHDDYVAVARQVVSKYPFFASPGLGSPYVS